MLIMTANFVIYQVQFARQGASIAGEVGLGWAAMLDAKTSISKYLARLPSVMRDDNSTWV